MWSKTKQTRITHNMRYPGICRNARQTFGADGIPFRRARLCCISSFPPFTFIWLKGGAALKLPGHPMPGGQFPQTCYKRPGQRAAYTPLPAHGARAGHSDYRNAGRFLVDPAMLPHQMRKCHPEKRQDILLAALNPRSLRLVSPAGDFLFDEAERLRALANEAEGHFGNQALPLTQPQLIYWGFLLPG